MKNFEEINRASMDIGAKKKFNFKWLLLSIILSIASINTAWGTSRKFKTGERIYFEDAAVIGGVCMKYSGNNLWAVFVGAGGNSDWIAASKQSGSWDAAGAIYYFDVPQFNSANYEFTSVIFTRNDWGIQTNYESPDEYYNYFKLTNYDNNKHVSGEWKKYSVNPMLIGSMNDWNPDASGYTFGDYDGSVCRLIVDLPADETYDFQILHGTGWYSYDNNKSGWTITNTTHESWQTLYAGNDNAQITTGEAGTYIFRYNDSDHSFAAYYPQSRLAKQTILYFDVADNTSWNNKTYTSKWYFKYWDSGNDYDSDHPETCSSPVESYKYYVTIPNNDWIGRVQVDRYDGASRQGGSDVAMAYNRSASTQNCVKAASGTSTSVTWTTYCPPTTSETFADNSTTKISWQPNTNDGSTSGKAIWVKTGTTLKVTASASKAVADGNMTVKYDFDVNSGSTTTNTTGSYNSTASTNNTQYAMNVKMYTNYNLDNTESSTKHTHTLYYKALNTYSVTHTLSGVTKASGRAGDDAAAYHVSYDATYTADAGYYLPSDVTVTIGGVSKTKGTDYTWTVTSGTSGALSILTDKIDGDVVVTINGTWRWSIAGSWNIITPGEGDPYWDPDNYAMGNIGTNASSKDTCYVEITLAANTNFSFDIVDRSTSPYTYHKYGTSSSYMTYGNSTNWAFSKNNTYDCGITTAGAGTYKFAYNITDGTLTVTYPTSYYVTAAGNPAAAGTVTPSSATYMSTTVGGEITATPNYSHYFNGWTSSAGGTFTSASSATTTFKPASAAATVTAAFPERTAFIEGNFQIYNSTRATRTKTGDSWQDASTAIKMTYDSENNRYYLHTYSTPAELAEQLNKADAYFYIKTSTSSSSIANDVTYHASASGDANQALSTYGSSNKKAAGSSEHSFKFTGSEDGYVIIYFNETHVWYELECALSYYGGDGATGDAPAARTFYAYNSTQTAPSNTYSKAGYVFTHWDTASDDSGTDYDPSDDVTMNAREVCLHAMWIVKYAMYGSLDDDDTEGAGMSGWSVADNFTYSADTYTLVLSLTKPNTLYKFRVLDHDGNISYGLATKAVIPEKTATKLDREDADAQLATAGTGNYTFTVVEDDGYPKITIVNPVSYLMTYGIVGDGGSWTSVVDGESNAIATGQYVKKDGSITFTANPSTGYEVEGWYSNSGCSTPYTNGSDGATISGAGNTVLTLTVTKARTVYVKIVPATLTWKSGYSWNDTRSWNPACVPTINHDVVIDKSCRVQVADAQAKSVTIHTGYNSKTGSLTIDASGALLVAEDVKVVRSEGGARGATTRSELWIETDYSGNGGLICGNASADTKAQYIFYSKVYRYGSYYINQYVGIPFAKMDPFDWYGVNIFEYDAERDDWMTPSNDSLKSFTCYDIISKYSGGSTMFYTNGTLNLPGTTDSTTTIECGERYSKGAIFDGTGDNKGDYMFANSWTAPISVAALAEDNPYDFLQEVHIFNAGFVGDTVKPAGDYPGQWTCITFEGASYTNDSVIPATQAFLMTAIKANAKLKLNYKKLVYDPAKNALDNSGHISTYPTRAPRRVKATGDPSVLRIKVMTDSTLRDNMYVFEREDFTFEYDNGWDGTKMFGESFAPQIYGIQGEGKRSISAVPEMDGAEIGFKAGTDTNAYTLSFEYNDDEPLYLYDKETNAYTEINNDATYSFTTSDRKAHERFLLTRSNAPQIATGVEEIDTENVQRAQKFMQDQQIFIRRGERVYSVDGTLVK